MDWTAVGEAGGGVVVSIASYLRGRTKAYEKVDHKLTACEDAHRRTQKELNNAHDKLSAIETEMVVLRKLLPGGEWFTKLGLDYHPYPPETDYRTNRRAAPDLPPDPDPVPPQGD